jgi:hypothetical protein
MLHVSGCDQCGQHDDHPKVHLFDGRTFHHDCLPYDIRAQVVENPVAAQAVAAAESGIRGGELRAHILSIPQEG